VPNFSECAQCECTSVAAFFFLCPNCQIAPNVNVIMLAHFWASYFCAQILRVHPIWISPKLSECAQCECTSVATSLAGYSLFHMWSSTIFSPVFFFQQCQQCYWSSPTFSVVQVKQYDFFTCWFFSAVPAEQISEVPVEHVSEAPAECVSEAPVEQSYFFSGTCWFFSVAHMKQYDFLSGTRKAVWFSFSSALVECVSVAPAEHFSAMQSDFKHKK